MKRKILFLFMGLMLVTSLVIAGCAKPAPAPTPPPKPIELTMVQALPAFDPHVGGFNSVVIDTINERAKGELFIKILGGPEVIPPSGQGMSVKKGVVDMAWCFTDDYKGLVPVGNMIMMSRLTYEEEVARGVWGLMNEIHMKEGIYILGRGDHRERPAFYLVCNKRVEKIEDFAGLAAGGITLAGGPLAEALGMSFSILPFGEVYTALERGVIDVYRQVLFTHTVQGTQDVAKYLIDHSFYNTNAVWIANLDTWNKLPKHLQSMMQDILMEKDPELRGIAVELEDQARQIFMDAGVEFIKFSPVEAERFVELAYSVGVAVQLEELPETGPKLWELLK